MLVSTRSPRFFFFLQKNDSRSILHSNARLLLYSFREDGHSSRCISIVVQSKHQFCNRPVQQTILKRTQIGSQEQKQARAKRKRLVFSRTTCFFSGPVTKDTSEDGITNSTCLQELRSQDLKVIRPTIAYYKRWAWSFELGTWIWQDPCVVIGLRYSKGRLWWFRVRLARVFGQELVEEHCTKKHQPGGIWEHFPSEILPKNNINFRRENGIEHLA